MTTIRTATADDAATILGFIRDLATFEREPEAVEVTEADLRADLAGDAPPFRCLLASRELDGSTIDVGMALYFPTYSTWTGRTGIHLEDLWVADGARGHGVGRALLGALAGEVLDAGGARLEWAVLDWNTPAIEVYDHLGAQPQDDWIRYRLDGTDLRALAGGRPAGITGCPDTAGTPDRAD